VPRKNRIPVVLDTNVVVGFYLSTSPASPNVRLWRLWRDRKKLQYIVCNELVEEYLDALARVGIAEIRIAAFAERLQLRETVDHVNLGARFYASRDPDDNVLLAAAVAGRAEFLITYDKDLLDISERIRRKFRFEIVTPWTFLEHFKDAWK